MVNQWIRTETVTCSGELSANTDIEASGTGTVVAVAYSSATAGNVVSVYPQITQGGTAIVVSPELSTEPSTIVFPQDARPAFTSGLSVGVTGVTDSIVVYYILDS